MLTLSVEVAKKGNGDFYVFFFHVWTHRAHVRQIFACVNFKKWKYEQGIYMQRDDGGEGGYSCCHGVARTFCVVVYMMCTVHGWRMRCGADDGADVGNKSFFEMQSMTCRQLCFVFEKLLYICDNTKKFRKKQKYIIETYCIICMLIIWPG